MDSGTEDSVVMNKLCNKEQLSQSPPLCLSLNKLEKDWNSYMERQPLASEALEQQQPCAR